MTGTHPLLARTPRRVCFAGDWHCNANFAAGRVMSAAAHGAEVLVQVGDFGFWPGPEGAAYVQALDKVARRSRLPILWIDGNHEAHTLISDLEQVEGLGKVSERIWHLPRGLRWQWGGLRWGTLGGATSVDRDLRVPMHDWWPQEAITPADTARWIEGGPVDVAVTHDAPAGLDIPGITREGGVVMWGAQAIDIAEAHRITLAEALEPTRPALVVHGHYHVRHETGWTYRGGRARVIGLDCDTHPAAGNTWLVDMDEIAEIVRQVRGEDSS